MKNFQAIGEIIDFINAVSSDANGIAVTSVDKLENEISRFKATNEIKDFEACIYTIPLERLLFFRSDSDTSMAIHLFMKPADKLADLIEADLGSYYMAASWGIEEETPLTIISWNYDGFNVDLRKYVKDLDSNFTFSPPQDIITISNEAYRKLQKEKV